MVDYHKKLAIAIYVILGVVFVTEGAYTFFDNPYVCIPVHVNYTGDYLLYFIEITQGILHLLIDLSITMIFIGGVAIRGALNYLKSDIIDLFLFIFFLISTLIHLNESFNEDRVVRSPLISLIPLLLIMAVVILKRSQNSNDNDSK